MGVAVLTIVVSVLAGTLLALVPQKNAGWMGPMRTFGFAAALSVALLHMVPESIEAIGGWAVPALGLGLMLPALLGGLGNLLWRAGHASLEPRHVELEAGYAGLLVHKVGDGLALGVYAGDLHRTGAAHGFAAALAAHIVPVVAIVVLTFDSVRGRGSALLRALGLALAGLLGVFLTRSVTLGDMAIAQGWLSAIAAGMLLHVVTHDLHVDLPQSPGARAIDSFVAVLGLLVSVWAGEAHAGHEEGAPPVSALLGILATWALPVTLLLVCGCLMGAAFSLSTRRDAQATGLRRLLAGASRTFAFEAVVMTFGLFGLGLGSVHLVLALLLGLALPLQHEPQADESSPSPDSESSRRGFTRYLAVLDARLLRVGGGTLVGVILAALVQTSLSGPIGSGFGWRELFWVALLAAPGYFCPTAAAPVGAVLVGQGLSPGLALGGVLLGPCLAGLAHTGRPARPLALIAALAIPVLAAVLATPLAHLGSGSVLHACHAGVGLALGGTAALVVLRLVFRAGFRGFLLGPRARPGGPLESMHHGHAHGVGRDSGSLG